MLFLALFLICYILIRKYRKDKDNFIISDLVWLFTPWAVSVAFYLYGGIEYESNLDTWSSLYLLLCGSIFLMFREFALKLKINESLSDSSRSVNTFPLFIFSLISGLLLIVYILSNNSIEWGYTRRLNFNMLYTTLYFCSCSSVVIWLYELAYSIKEGKKIKKHAYLCVLIYLIHPILISGREGLLYIIFFSIIIKMHCKSRNNNDTLNILKKYRMYNVLGIWRFFIVVPVLCYLIFLSNNRYGNSMISLFEWSSNCYISDDLLDFIEGMGIFGPLILNFVYYYSSQLSKFAFVFDYYDGPYLGGLFQFSILSRRLPESWQLNFTEVTEAARALMESKGFYGLHSMWDTGIGYFIYDFGRIGALFEVAFIGLITGLVIKRYRKNSNIINLIYLDFLCVGLFVTSMYSPVFSTAWLFPLIWVYIFDNYYKRIHII